MQKYHKNNSIKCSVKAYWKKQLAEMHSSEKLWADLQRRLRRKQIFKIWRRNLCYYKELPQKKNIFQRAYNIVWKRHKYLTGIAAACLVIIISLQVAPSSDTSNFLQRFLVI